MGRNTALKAFALASVLRAISIVLVTVGLLAAGVVLLGQPLRRAEGAAAPPGVTHTYYIAADEIDWNYAPAEMDHMTGKPYDERARVFIDNTPEQIGRIYKKAIYREYTDASFTTLKARSSAWEHLGIVGPVLRGEVGDTLKIVFKNNARFPFSMHGHGVRYDQASDGVAGVPPGGTFTYTWIIDPRTGPQAGEPSSKFWLYHSHSNEQRDMGAGLVGGIIVSARGTVKQDGTPKVIDREFVAVFYTIDENASWYLDQNIAAYVRDPKTLRKTALVFRDIDGQPVNVGFPATNLRETINGYLFANTPGLTMKQGDRVRWYTAGLGFHTAHWHANTVRLDNNSVDVVPLSPAEMHTTDMMAENPGVWMFHCHVEGHLANGMYAHYTVEPVGKQQTRRVPRP